MPDARVESALKNLAPRFLAHGVEYADLVQIGARIESWAGWLDAWVETAEDHERLADEAERRGRTRTAGEARVRAAVCYHFAKFLWLEDLERYWATTRRSVGALARGRAQLDPTFLRLELPFDRDRIFANLRRPSDVGRAAVVVLVPGLDSTKEELTSWEEHFLVRGLATVALDGPGQGEAGAVNTIRPDYEAPVGALLDALGGREELDVMRVGIVGPGLGGYYAARAALADPRIKAVGMIGSPYTLVLRSAQTREKFMHAAGLSDPAEADRHAARFTLVGRLGALEQPLLVIHGRQDGMMPWEDARQMADEAPRGELRLYPEGGTGCHTVHHLYKPALADWMTEKLGT